MSKQSNSIEDIKQPFLVANKSISVIILALIIFSISFYSWWKNIYNSPENVFNGMINNNLRIASVTRESKIESADTPQQKIEQLNFVPDYAVRSIITLQQNDNGQDNKVVSETIGTLKADYSRYVTIKTSQTNSEGKPLDYSSVENIWSKSDPESEQPQYFNQSVLGLIMFGNIDQKTRNEYINTLKDKKAYDIQYKDAKPQKINGKSALVIPVKVNLEGYVQAVKVVAKQVGLGDLPGLEPEAYKDQTPIEIKVTIDKLSRQLLKVEYSENQIETYSSYGIKLPVELPEKTISTSELQQKVQEVK